MHAPVLGYGYIYVYVFLHIFKILYASLFNHRNRQIVMERPRKHIDILENWYV